MAFADACRTLANALSHHRECVAAAIAGIDSAAHRRWYAQVVLNRLLLLYDLQVAGFLGRGDRWYLHTHLGTFQQQNPDSFFKQGLQPLCLQGMGLPELERPLPLPQTWGPVPYLGGLFQRHPLEQQYPDLDLPDDPLEAFLGWLAEQTWHRTPEPSPDPNAVTRSHLAGALEYLATDSTGKGTITPPSVLGAICDRTVDAYVLQALQRHQSVPATDLDECLTHLDDVTCSLLIKAILPQVTVLDPACGSGRFLLMALERLQQIYTACWAYAQTSQDVALQDWRRSLYSSSNPVPWRLTQTILTQNLYGVDLHPAVIEIAQCQLWLALLSTVSPPAPLAPLPDLDFNITVGNALVGFIRVDEESFDQIFPKRTRSGPTSEPVLQGNLLQPLAAASYRDTLAEKQIRVEHYRAQTQAMAEATGIPEYVQTAFLRDRIDEVNQATQDKLNRLLWQTFSQKLGIQMREPHPVGRTQKRLLTLEDIEALHPLHWGFFFNQIWARDGGFAVIVTQPPSGPLRPHPDEFYSQYESLFQTHGLDRATFRRSRRSTLLQVPALAKLWAQYAGRFNCLKDYVRRSEDYSFSASPSPPRHLSRHTLFAQRCAALLNPHSISPYLHTPGALLRSDK